MSDHDCSTPIPPEGDDHDVGPAPAVPARGSSGEPEEGAASAAPDEGEALEPAEVLPPFASPPFASGPFVPPASRELPEFPLFMPPRFSTGGPQVLRRPEDRAPNYTSEQRMLILDAWLRSGLPAKDFGMLVGVSRHTLYSWKKRFEDMGPAGLEDRQRNRGRGTGRVSEATKRAILLLKHQNPTWGADRIHYVLIRSEGLAASVSAIRRVLADAGYEAEPQKAPRHPDKPRRFERARANQMWQSDLFTFVLKRQNRRVHLVAFLDDHSRFVVGYGLHASASGALVREVFEQAIASWGAPEEVLTDNGAQYVTWRGKSKFAELCERRGIRHVIARPRHPQTLGKTERFWGTLWRECVASAVFTDLGEARQRIGLFVDHYNFQRPHQGIEGLVPADRFFGAAPEVLKTLKARVALNAAELARDGVPRKDVYLTGRVGGVGISLHAEGDEVILTQEDGTREAVNLRATGRRGGPDAAQELPEPLSATGAPPDAAATEGPVAPPGASALDAALGALASAGVGAPGGNGAPLPSHTLASEQPPAAAADASAEEDTEDESESESDRPVRHVEPEPDPSECPAWRADELLLPPEDDRRLDFPSDEENSDEADGDEGGER